MDEHAVVLKHLKLRADRQGDELAQLTGHGAALLESVAQERAPGEEVMALLGLDGESPHGRENLCQRSAPH